MSNCRCHAGKICDIHVEEVMDNLNKAVGGIHGGIVGGHLGSPTPEQIDADDGYEDCDHFRQTCSCYVGHSKEELPDLHGEIVKPCLRVKKLEDDRKFNLGLIENLASRLNNLEDKSQFRFAQGFHRGRESVLRTNQSGCCCIVNDSDEIVSVCGAHEQWGDNLLERLNKAEGKLEAIEEQFLHFIELRKMKGGMDE